DWSSVVCSSDLRRCANALGALGVTAGERVFVMLPRVYQWWEIILGCIRARVVSVPGTTLLTPKDIEYRLNLAEASVVITDEDNQEKLERVLPQCPTVKRRIVVGRGGGWHEYEDLLR